MDCLVQVTRLNLQTRCPSRKRRTLWWHQMYMYSLRRSSRPSTIRKTSCSASPSSKCRKARSRLQTRSRRELAGRMTSWKIQQVNEVASPNRKSRWKRRERRVVCRQAWALAYQLTRQPCKRVVARVRQMVSMIVIKSLLMLKCKNSSKNLCHSWASARLKIRSKSSLTHLPFNKLPHPMQKLKGKMV